MSKSLKAFIANKKENPTIVNKTNQNKPKPSSLVCKKSNSSKNREMTPFDWEDEDGNLIAISFENTYPLLNYFKGIDERCVDGVNTLCPCSGQLLYRANIRELQQRSDTVISDEEVDFFKPLTLKDVGQPYYFFPVDFAGNTMEDILLLKDIFQSFDNEEDPSNIGKTPTCLLSVSETRRRIVKEEHFDLFVKIASEVRINPNISKSVNYSYLYI
jgi:hypothetical protein